ncbi:MAG: glycosyltransferase family 39 protein [Anaerolineae bacterium]|nr:glycosyltransferase family 39 protein [Anaerolineae bacterium]
MNRRIFPWLILSGIIILAGCLRWVGINWDDYTHSHPDELFLTTITSEIGERDELLDEVAERCDESAGFFNTRCNPLNPNNIEPGSFAYGTLPVFIVKGTAELVAGITGDDIWLDFDGIHLVGRFVNVIVDLISVLMVVVIGRRFLSTRRSLLAALLYAAAVLPIQLSHFWTVDIMAHMWFLVALYAAIVIGQTGRVWAYVLFGLALGAGMASRINIAVAAVLAPLAALIYVYPRFDSYVIPRRLREWPAAIRTHGRDWLRILRPAALLLVLAALVCLGAFRFAQPYAFKGPHIWDIGLNDKWVDDITHVSHLSAEQSNGWPPSHQFVGRAAYVYPWSNMALWGMGLALGLLVTAALIAITVRLIRRRWQFPAPVIIMLAWIVVYFGWHGRLHFMTMRYYLPLYAVLCLLAAWWLAQLPQRAGHIIQIIAVFGTFFWAFAFTGIYRSPQTRVDAALWITDNFPATLTGVDANGDTHYFKLHNSLRYRMATYFKTPFGQTPEVYPSEELEITISEPDENEAPADTSAPDEPDTPDEQNTLDDNSMILRRLWLRWVEPVSVNVSLQLYQLDDKSENAQRLLDFSAQADEFYELRVDLPLDEQGGPIILEPGTYRWEISVDWPENIDSVHLIATVEYETPDGELALSPIRLPDTDSSYVRYAQPGPDYPQIVRLIEGATLTRLFVPHVIGPEANLVFTIDDEDYTAHFSESDDSTSLLGDGRWYTFDDPVDIPTNTNFDVTATEPLWITGTAIATEGSWELATPTRICFREDTTVGYHSYDDCRNTSGFDTGWYSEVRLEIVRHDKESKARTLSDTLLKADYLTISSNRMYDALPRNRDYYWYTKQFYDDLFDGDLGYRQIKRFDSFPHVGPFVIPDQVLPDDRVPGWLNEWEAEEAFTVYDHPTVYVFENTDYTPDRMTAYFPWYDERNRINLDTVADTTYTAPESAPSETRLWIMTGVWAAVFTALGWFAFPLVYTLLPSLGLRGYAFGRGAAWLLLALIPWWLTALAGLPLWTRGGLFVVVALFILAMLLLYRRQGPALRQFIRAHWRGMLALDLLWLAAFALGIVIRGVNPDYWHPVVGGEKHMDLAYLNAVWRTGEFPPPNPWMSGLAINYYYFGFVIAAMPLKVLGIAPEIGANLVLATVYGVVWSQVFVLALNVLKPVPRRWRLTLAGLSTILVMLAGNLGTLYLIIKPEDNMYPHRWYWYPTRIIGESANGGGGMFNEVPFFSFLYGDLHAHIIDLLPVTLLLVGLWAFFQQRDRWLAAVIGGLVGIIYITNAWDIAVYAPLVLLVVLASGLLVAGHPRRYMLTILIALAFGGLIVTGPYLRDFTLSEYSGIDRWEGPRTLIGPFLLVWGGPLIVLGLWMAHRIKRLLTPDADAPVEIGVLLLFLLPALTVGGEDGTSVLLALALITSTALAWGDRNARYVHLAASFFFAGLLAIEHIVIKGDVARMNTGFKVSFQLWIWLGLLIPVILFYMARDRVTHGWRGYLKIAVCVVALLPGLLYPVKSLPARTEDSHSDHFSLNGYAFMQNLLIDTGAGKVTLAEDAALIAFMRANLDGYPVIAETYDSEYHWNNRIASYTGLPSVTGWQNHLRQQYLHHNDEITERVNDIRHFYETDDPEDILGLVAKYDIQYIVSGTIERAIAHGQQRTALDRLVDSGHLTVVFEQGATRLYRVEDAPVE